MRKKLPIHQIISSLRKISIPALLMALLFLGSRCNKPTMLGQSLVAGVDNVHTFATDTFTVIANTIYKFDSLAVNRGYYEMQLGSINADPIFGKTTAAGYTQFGLPNGQFFFSGDNVRIDSVVLSLAYNGFYGDSMTAQRFNVYPVTDPTFNDTTIYYAFQQFQYDAGNLIGSAVAAPHDLEDSVSVFNTHYAPQLRIKLSDAFANDLLQQKTNGAFFNDSAFHLYLRGLAIVPDTVAGGKSQLFFDLNSSDTRITIFYKNDKQDSLTASFPFNSLSCAHANYIGRNYAGAEAARYINSNNTAGDSLLYLQDPAGRYITSTASIPYFYTQLQRSPGLYVNIRIPSLQSFPNAIINKAELILTQVTDGPASGDAIYTAPPWLFLEQYQRTDTVTNFLYDTPFSLGGSNGVLGAGNLGYFGGNSTTFTNAEGAQVVQYTFNISRYLQHLISEGVGGGYDTSVINNGFRLLAFNPYYGFPPNYGRVKLGGGNHSEYRIRLRVIYTKL